MSLDPAGTDTGTTALLDSVRRDGGRLTAEATLAPVTWPEGGTGTVVVFRDVTAREQVEQMKHEFISSVSHELRTPLTAIHGALELLVDGDAGALPEHAEELARVAERGSARLGRLVNDIIDVERLASGTFRVTLVDHELPALVESTVMLMQPRAQERGVRLVVGPLAGRVLCDADRVAQVLVNLLDNACKFTPTGGTVRVEATVGEHEVVVSVSDEGRGIPAAELESIFAPFHQVRSAGTEDEGGTGLGLAITRSIVERHGGRIWVESEPEVGSRFAFTLPLVLDTQPLDAAPGAATDSGSAWAEPT
jgi:signal transduction histidine kinase